MGSVRRRRAKAHSSGGNANNLFAQAVARHHANDLAAAAWLYDQVLTLNPDHVKALTYAGALAVMAGDPAGGLIRVRRANSLAPNDASLMAYAGESLRMAGELADAETLLRRSLSLSPNDPKTLNYLGCVLLDRGDSDGAFQAFTTVQRIQPDHAEAAFNLGVLNLDQKNVAEAVRNFDLALAQNPRDAEALCKKGEALVSLGRDDEAAACLEAVIAHPAGMQSSPKTLMSNLVSIYMRLRRFADATAAYRRAIHRFPSAHDLKAEFAVWLDWLHKTDEARSLALKVLEKAPQQAQAVQVLARLDKTAGRLEAARRRIEDLPRERWDASIHFELASIAEYEGRDDEAFDLYAESNRSVGEQPHWKAVDPGRMQATLERVREWSTPDHLYGLDCALPDDGLASPIFMVGFPRSGTTLLENVIGATDHVVISDEKPFLSDTLNLYREIVGERAPVGLETLSVGDVGALRAAYWAAVGAGLDEPLQPGQHLLDKQPLNLIHLALIRRLFPDAPVLVALRDPRDVIVSNFKQYFLPNNATVHFLTLEGTARIYAKVMNLWLRYRTDLPGPWREVRYEDVVGNFDATITGMLAFLGLSWSDAYRDFHKKAAKRFITTPSSGDVATPVYDRSVGRWRGFVEHLEPHLDVLESVAESLGYRVR